MAESMAKIMPDSSLAIHFNGFINGFKNIGVLGRGLGNAGVILSKLTSISDSVTGESYIGVLSGQLGYLGLTAFILLFGFVIWGLLVKYKKTSDKVYYMIAGLLLCVLFQSLFSESSIAILNTGLYFIFAGIYLQ